MTTRACSAIQAKPSTVIELAQAFGVSRDRMLLTVNDLVRRGCVRRTNIRRNGVSVYEFVMMPPPPGRRATKTTHVSQHAPGNGDVVRPYQPVWKPLVRDPFEMWKLREDPATSQAAVHSCRV